jgi:hypothetical protein
MTNIMTLEKDRPNGYNALAFFNEGNIMKNVSKRQTRREAGTQSHGSSSLMRRDWKTARPPKFWSAVFRLI